MSNTHEAELVEALKAYIKATPFRRGWDITTPHQRSAMSAASRKLNAVLKVCGISRESAILKYGPTLF